jgi:hypothetical protein
MRGELLDNFSLLPFSFYKETLSCGIALVLLHKELLLPVSHLKVLSLQFLVHDRSSKTGLYLGGFVGCCLALVEPDSVVDELLHPLDYVGRHLCAQFLGHLGDTVDVLNQDVVTCDHHLFIYNRLDLLLFGAFSY